MIEHMQRHPALYKYIGITIVLEIMSYKLVSSADNLCKQFGTRSGLTKCWA